MAEPSTKKDRTSTLFHKLIDTPDLPAFIQNNAGEMELPSFHAYITELCMQTGQVPEQVIKQAGIERTYGHQLFNGTRKPSRDKVLQLAFGLKLDIDGAQKLLQLAEKSALYPRIKRDAAVLFSLSHHLEIMETQSLLESLDLTLLGGE